MDHKSPKGGRYRRTVSRTPKLPSVTGKLNTKRAPMKKPSARDNALRIVDYLGGRCQDCKRAYPIYVYDLHCSDPRMDIMSFAVKVKLKPFDKIKADLDNCVLLCANCHRIRHHESKMG